MIKKTVTAAVLIWALAAVDFTAARLTNSTAVSPPAGNQSEDDARGRPQDRPDVEVQPASNALELEPERGPRQRRGGIQTTIENGVSTTTVSEPERDIRIVEDPRSGITVTIVRNYGPQDLDRLKNRLPELTDYVEMFPREMGDHQIELNLTVKSTFRARTPAELKVQHPEAFNLYRRYRKSR